MSGKPEPSGEVCEMSREELLHENARLRGDLLTIARRISHDLRTPLGGIAITGEMIKEILEENGTRATEIVAPIFDSADGVARLIERMSFVLKASAHSSPMTQVKMGDAVFNTLQRLERQILKSGAQLAEPAEWPEVNGVASWLEAVWWNFLANAVQHEKKISKIELGWRQEKNGFRFWVNDDGGGVPPEKIAKLFQPFHLLHEPNARQGLGLSIVQRLVELQHGNCGYEPNDIGGSFFYFTLPLAVA
jgi:K+-sensing histidine kinase KdpD